MTYAPSYCMGIASAATYLANYKHYTNIKSSIDRPILIDEMVNKNSYTNYFSTVTHFQKILHTVPPFILNRTNMVIPIYFHIMARSSSVQCSAFTSFYFIHSFCISSETFTSHYIWMHLDFLYNRKIVYIILEAHR